MLPIAEIASKPRWVCGEHVYKGEIFLTDISEPRDPNECYLQGNNCHESLLKNYTYSNDVCIVKCAYFVFYFVVDMCFHLEPENSIEYHQK